MLIGCEGEVSYACLGACILRLRIGIEGIAYSGFIDSDMGALASVVIGIPLAGTVEGDVLILTGQGHGCAIAVHFIASADGVEGRFDGDLTASVNGIGHILDAAVI